MNTSQNIQRDPIRLELLKNAFAAISDEMAATVVRTARSYVIKEAMDFSTGLIDAQGNLISQGLCLPMHMGSFPPTIETIIARFKGDMFEGDVYITNDPYTGGGTHLPDIYVFKPIFFEGVLLGFSAAIGHQTDIGGRVAGGNACDNTEIYQEGLRLPPVRLFSKGVLNQDLMAACAASWTPAFRPTAVSCGLSRSRPNPARWCSRPRQRR
jgi:N-methylhydantoinase B